MKNIRYDEHTDSVSEKLRLLQDAYQAGRHALAMALSDSIKDTIAFERGALGDGSPPVLPAEASRPVAELPDAWKEWADGWSHVTQVSLFETVGIARVQEPVELSLGVRADQVQDLGRELRVARVDPDDGTLREIPSQVDAETRHGSERRCRLTFLAEVPQHGRAFYLVFFGNPFAERPEYLTDLRVHGEGYGIDIINQHFEARLSRQMGQLERLISKREHGLELYAGGKGHGEPPGIDWAHDYVDQGGFQKLRVRNWSDCPNVEVTQGPVFVRVRRWGFPHSPVHPLFTPSRIHIDQTYTFFAGLPYFLKEGTMEAIQDVRVEAMRDDEWVFSGYSFDEALWIDRHGRLHEGAVPAEHAQDLWGVGFYHRVSRDAFLALWLEHAARNFEDLSHNGSPNLHYDGHGQLWSRYPVQGTTTLKAGTSFHQKNAYLLFAYPDQNASGMIETMRHRLRSPLDVQVGERSQGQMPAAPSPGALARFGETRATAPLKPAIWDLLREVQDEQLYTIDANIVDLGYVYDVRVRHGVAYVLVTMPHRGRPVHEFLVSRGGGRVADGIRERLRKLDGVREVVVDLTWNPPWTAARLSDAARSAMGLDA